MTQASIQESIPNYEGAPVPKPELVVETPELIFETDTPPKIAKAAIERVSAFAFSPALLLRRAEDVMQVSRVNVQAFPAQYARLLSDVKTASNMGELDLETKYPDVIAEERPTLFILEMFEKASVIPSIQLSVEEESRRSVERAQAQLSGKQDEIDTLVAEKRAQTKKVIALRKLFVTSGANEAQLAEFDRTAEIQTALEAEADENESSWTDRFKNVISTLIPRKALDSIGIYSPRSAEVKIVHTKK